jgi:hypothetical protein
MTDAPVQMVSDTVNDSATAPRRVSSITRAISRATITAHQKPTALHPHAVGK